VPCTNETVIIWALAADEQQQKYVYIRTYLCEIMVKLLRLFAYCH